MVKEKLAKITSEQISKELSIQDEVMKEILSKNQVETFKKTLTNPSSPALTTTLHSAGEGLDRVRKTVKQLFTLYLTNQFISRAINVRGDTLVSAGYTIQGEDQTGVNPCTLR